jgi:transcriptional regulator with XRE-family HTH domain
MTTKTLKTLLEEAGYTYRGLAKEVHTSHGMLIAYGNGSRVPRLDTSICIAAKLKVSLKTFAASLGQDVSLLPDDGKEANDNN